MISGLIWGLTADELRGTLMANQSQMPELIKILFEGMGIFDAMEKRIDDIEEEELPEFDRELITKKIEEFSQFAAAVISARKTGILNQDLDEAYETAIFFIQTLDFGLAEAAAQMPPNAKDAEITKGIRPVQTVENRAERFNTISEYRLSAIALMVMCDEIRKLRERGQGEGRV